MLLDRSFDKDTGPWGTYNKAMDRLFGKDCRVGERLTEFKRGPLGLDMVVDFSEYFFSLPNFEVDLAVLKINTLIEEAQFYMYVTTYFEYSLNQTISSATRYLTSMSVRQ